MTDTSSGGNESMNQTEKAVSSTTPFLPAWELPHCLNDRVFVDYFNVFLSLPIFSQRCLYRYSQQNFEFDPPIRRTKRKIHKQGVYEWLVKERVPFFVKTSLYSECKLCSRMSLTSKLYLKDVDRNGIYDRAKVADDRALLKKCIGSVLGMKQFRQYIEGGSGGLLLAFWMDAEHLFTLEKNMTDKRWELFRDIQRKYFASFRLLSGIDFTSSWDLNRLFPNVCCNRLDISHEQTRVLQDLQAVVLNILQHYWLPKFILHIYKMGDKSIGVDEQETVLFQNIANDELSKLIAKLETHLKSPGNILIREFQISAKDAAQTPTSETCNSYSQSKGSHARGKKGTLKGTKQKRDKEDMKMTASKVSTLTQANLKAFESQTKQRCKSGSELDVKVQTRSLLKSKSKMRKYCLPKLTQNAASTKCHYKRCKTPLVYNQARLSPITRVPLPSEAYKQNEIPIDCMIFPAEPDPIYETIRSYRLHNSIFTQSINADSYAGGPFRAFLERNSQNTLMRLLHFWHDAQDLIEMTVGDSTEYNYLVSQHARSILRKYLIPSGENYLHLPRKMNRILQQYLMLPEGRHSSMVTRHAQDIACQVLREQWEMFVNHDREACTKAISVPKQSNRQQTKSNSETPVTLPSTGFRPVTPQEIAQSFSTPLSFTTPTKPLTKRIVSRTPKVKSKGLPTIVTPEIISYSAVESPFFVLPGEVELLRPKTGVQDSVASVSGERMLVALKLAKDIARAGDTLFGEEFTVSESFDSSDDLGSLRYKRHSLPRATYMIRDFVNPPKLKLDGLKVSMAKSMAEIRIRGGEDTSQDWDANLPTYLRPIKKNGKWHNRPLKPRNFNELLNDDIHREFFKKFLITENAESPLKFWIDVHEMKSKPNTRAKMQRVVAIMRKYFSKAAGKGSNLNCSSEIVRQIPNMGKVTPAILISAQACVTKSLEEKWYGAYLETFPDVETKPREPQEEVQEPADFSEIVAKKWTKKKTKALWMMFISSVISFCKGIMNKETMKNFQKYIRREIKRERDKEYQRRLNEKKSKAGGKGDTPQLSMGMIKKVIKNKMVFVDKLINDLAFWVEVDRYRMISDNATMAAKAGIYSEADQELVEMKAKAIIACFLESDIPPKLQINISNELAENIIDDFHNGVLERGLFHEATMAVFPVLVHLWRRFCRKSFVPGSEIHVGTPEKNGGRVTPHAHLDYIDYKNIDPHMTERVFTMAVDPEHQHLYFTIAQGLRHLMAGGGREITDNKIISSIKIEDLPAGISSYRVPSRLSSKMSRIGTSKGSRRQTLSRISANVSEMQSNTSPKQTKPKASKLNIQRELPTPDAAQKSSHLPDELKQHSPSPDLGQAKGSTTQNLLTVST